MPGKVSGLVIPRTIATYNELAFGQERDSEARTDVGPTTAQRLPSKAAAVWVASAWGARERPVSHPAACAAGRRLRLRAACAHGRRAAARRRRAPCGPRVRRRRERAGARRRALAAARRSGVGQGRPPQVRPQATARRGVRAGAAVGRRQGGSGQGSRRRAQAHLFLDAELPAKHGCAASTRVGWRRGRGSKERPGWGTGLPWRERRLLAHSRSQLARRAGGRAQGAADAAGCAHTCAAALG